MLHTVPNILHIKFKKELLNILSSKVKNHIREEIEDSKFCIVVDEARDE